MEALMQQVKFDYGWRLRGKWSVQEVENLLVYASRFATSISNITGRDGTVWIRDHVGGAVIHLGAVPNMIMRIARAGGMVPTHKDVILPRNFGQYILIHEMGHVFDNNVKNGILPATYNGGGASDALVAAMGGNPLRNLPRFNADNLWYRDNIAGNDPWPAGAYGNHGVADDFAETFVHTLMGNPVPLERRAWMTEFLTLWP